MAAPKYDWEKEVDGLKFSVSNDKEMLNHEFVNEAFASEDTYWAKPLSPEVLNVMLDNCCTLGLYTTKQMRLEANRNMPHSTTKVPIQVGLARLITDYATVAYLTDVYIRPEHQGKGLGKWLISCVKEVIDAIPSLRVVMLLTRKTGKGIRFYEEELGMTVSNVESEKVAIMCYKPQSSSLNP